MANLNDIPAPDRPRSADTAIMEDAAGRIEAMLDSAQTCDPASFSSALRSEPVRTELQAILAQLDPALLLPVLHRLATSGLPDQREVMEALLAADPSGSGQVVRGRLDASYRQAVVARVFHPDRVQALRRACRPPIQEHA